MELMLSGVTKTMGILQPYRILPTFLRKGSMDCWGRMGLVKVR